MFEYIESLQNKILAHGSNCKGAFRKGTLLKALKIPWADWVEYGLAFDKLVTAGKIWKTSRGGWYRFV